MPLPLPQTLTGDPVVEGLGLGKQVGLPHSLLGQLLWVRAGEVRPWEA